MELKIEGRNLQISQRLQMHIARKLGQVGRHLPAATTAVVEITSEPTRSHQERIQVQVFLNVKGAIIRAERRGPSAIAALNAAAASLDQSAARFKGQVYRSQRARQCLSVGEQQAAEMFESDRELAREFAPEVGDEEDARLALLNG